MRKLPPMQAVEAACRTALEVLEHAKEYVPAKAEYCHARIGFAHRCLCEVLFGYGGEEPMAVDESPTIDPQQENGVKEVPSLGALSTEPQD